MLLRGLNKALDEVPSDKRPITAFSWICEILDALENGTADVARAAKGARLMIEHGLLPAVSSLSISRPANSARSPGADGQADAHPFAAPSYPRDSLGAAFVLDDAQGLISRLTDNLSDITLEPGVATSLHVAERALDYALALTVVGGELCALERKKMQQCDNIIRGGRAGSAAGTNQLKEVRAAREAILDALGLYWYPRDADHAAQMRARPARFEEAASSSHDSGSQSGAGLALQELLEGKLTGAEFAKTLDGAALDLASSHPPSGRVHIHEKRRRVGRRRVRQLTKRMTVDLEHKAVLAATNMANAPMGVQ